MRRLLFSTVGFLSTVASGDVSAQSFLQSQGGIGGIVGNLLNNIRPQQPSYQPPPQYQPPYYAQPPQYAPPPPPPTYSQDQRQAPLHYQRPAQNASPPTTRQRVETPSNDAFASAPSTAPSNPRAAVNRSVRPTPDAVAAQDDPFANQAPPLDTPAPAPRVAEDLLPVTTPPPNKTVHVIGRGATVSEARTDAVRQALQQTMQQLIVVDRAISNDEVTRNSILSTMNGYVEAFEETRSFVENRQYALEANVTVSASRVVNFIGTTSGASASISGQSIAANRERIAANRRVKGELFDRLFRGYPAADLDLAIKKVSLPENDIDHLYIDFAIRFSPAFIASLKSGLAAIAEHRTRNAYDRDKASEPSMGGCGVAECSRESVEAQQFLLFNTYETINMNRRQGRDLPTRLCIYGQSEDCYELPLGEYGTSFAYPGAPNLKYSSTAILIRFLDKTGQPVGADGASSLCTVADAINVSFLPQYYSDVRPNRQARKPIAAYDLMPLKLDLKNQNAPDSYLFDYTRIVRAVIPISSINLDKTDRIAAYAAQNFTDPHDRRKSGVLLDLLQGPVDQGTACDKLDQAAQLSLPK